MVAELQSLPLLPAFQEVIDLYIFAFDALEMDMGLLA